ncbi:pseudouridine synthase [Methylobacterium soli]|uniref:Pseudouridine synthase n=1 Tax=Methylobacterium soli TaxID=553447 RepID=A0A6L3T3M2_9HYPH|nr:pseudouridine synthase [Methylobacterium soli]
MAEAEPETKAASRAKTVSKVKPEPKVSAEAEPRRKTAPAASDEAEAAPAEAWAPATDANTGTRDPAKAVAPRTAKKQGGDAPLRRRAAPPARSEAVIPAVTPPGAAPAQADEAPAETHEGERIAKAIARAGIASRRDAEAMIAEGRVSLNGRVLASPAVNVTEDDVITVDGEPLPARERTRLWIFHKPRGLVTTARDPEGRQTVFEALPDDLPRVVAVGRLDINTEGLLLLTNDGGLAKVIAHPDTGWLRRYRVRAHGDTNQAELDKLRKGVTIDGMEYGPVEANLDRVQGDNLWLTLGLREGKNREVKRILEHLGLSVNRLIRLSFGPFQLGDLEAGLVDEIRTKVLKEQLGPSLAAQAGVDFESPVREPIAPFGSPKASRGTEQAPRPAKSAASAERRARGPAFGAPPSPARVPTGGMGAGPRRSVWRADEPAEGAPRSARVPRRGADPRAERAAAASERGRERVGAIRTGERRVVVERLKSSPVEEAPEAAPRRYARAPDGSRPVRAPRPDHGDRGLDRGLDRGDRGSDRGDRRPDHGDRRADRGSDRGDRRPDRGEERGFRPRPEGGRTERSGGDRFGGREDRGFRGGSSSGESGSREFKPRGSGPRASGPWDAREHGSRDRDAKPRAARSGERSFGGRDGGNDKGGGFKGARPGGASDRGGFGRTGGERTGGERTGGDKPRGGKPGGFGSKPGGFGGKPGGARAGGGKPGGFGGKPGGFGGKPGGFGGKPGGRPSGGKPGGRPPRGGAR